MLLSNSTSSSRMIFGQFSFLSLSFCCSESVCHPVIGSDSVDYVRIFYKYQICQSVWLLWMYKPGSESSVVAPEGDDDTERQASCCSGCFNFGLPSPRQIFFVCCHKHAAEAVCVHPRHRVNQQNTTLHPSPFGAQYARHLLNLFRIHWIQVTMLMTNMLTSVSPTSYFLNIWLFFYCIVCFCCYPP